MKKILALVIIFILFFMFVPKKTYVETQFNTNDRLSNFEDQSSNQLKINDLIDKRAKLISRYGYNDYLNNIDKQLLQLGVEKLTSEKIQGFMDVTWMTYRNNYTDSDGKIYNVQTLIAQPDSPKSNLVTQGYRVVSDMDILYSYNHITTVSFKYVKLKNQNDKQQVLSYVSTKGTTSIAHMYSSLEFNGKVVKPVVKQGKRVMDSTPFGYNQDIYAIQGYLDMTPRKNYVTNVGITGLDRKVVFCIGPICPVYPSQIF